MATNEDSSTKGSDDTIKEVTEAANGNGSVKPKSIWFLLGIIEAGLSLIFWGYSEFFGGHNAPILSNVFFFLFVTTVWAGIAGFVFKHWPRKWVIVPAFIFLSGFGGVVICLYSRHNPEPHPHFVLSLQIGDSSAQKMWLTNDFLFVEDLWKGSNRADGSFLFKGYVYGCLVIPVMPGESNKVFNINAELDSPESVHDLQCLVAVPKRWKCLVGQIWQQNDPSFIIPSLWRLEITNMQGWSVQVPQVMRQYDIATFSITNCSIDTYIGPESIGGLLSFGIRTDFLNEVLGMNVIFVPSTPEFSKPVITRGFIDSDGQLQVPMPLKIPSLSL